MRNASLFVLRICEFKIAPSKVFEIIKIALLFWLIFYFLINNYYFRKMFIEKFIRFSNTTQFAALYLLILWENLYSQNQKKLKISQKKDIL